MLWKTWEETVMQEQGLLQYHKVLIKRHIFSISLIILCTQYHRVALGVTT